MHNVAITIITTKTSNLGLKHIKFVLLVLPLIMKYSENIRIYQLLNFVNIIVGNKLYWYGAYFFVYSTKHWIEYTQKQYARCSRVVTQKMTFLYHHCCKINFLSNVICVMPCIYFEIDVYIKFIAYYIFKFSCQLAIFR